MYASTNFKTKKSLKDAVARGDEVMIYHPLTYATVTVSGDYSIEGPHYPQPHAWYARVTLNNGRIVKVR
jgi:hypothetical protein